MNKRKTGALWEEYAARCLTEAGAVITERNFRCSRGEIDLIGYHQGCLVFWEVKYRSDDRFGTALEAVTEKKQRTICRCAQLYLYQHRIPPDRQVHFDVAAICAGKMVWIRNAFDYRR